MSNTSSPSWIYDIYPDASLLAFQWLSMIEWSLNSATKREDRSVLGLTMLCWYYSMVSLMKILAVLAVVG